MADDRLRARWLWLLLFACAVSVWTSYRRLHVLGDLNRLGDFRNISAVMSFPRHSSWRWGLFYITCNWFHLCVVLPWQLKDYWQLCFTASSCLPAVGVCLGPHMYERVWLRQLHMLVSPSAIMVGVLASSCLCNDQELWITDARSFTRKQQRLGQALAALEGSIRQNFCVHPRSVANSWFEVCLGFLLAYVTDIRMEGKFAFEPLDLFWITFWVIVVPCASGHIHSRIYAAEHDIPLLSSVGRAKVKAVPQGLLHPHNTAMKQPVSLAPALHLPMDFVPREHCNPPRPLEGSGKTLDLQAIIHSLHAVGHVEAGVKRMSMNCSSLTLSVKVHNFQKNTPFAEAAQQLRGLFPQVLNNVSDLSRLHFGCLQDIAVVEGCIHLLGHLQQHDSPSQEEGLLHVELPFLDLGNPTLACAEMTSAVESARGSIAATPSPSACLFPVAVSCDAGCIDTMEAGAGMRVLLPASAVKGRSAVRVVVVQRGNLLADQLVATEFNPGSDIATVRFLVQPMPGPLGFVRVYVLASPKEGHGAPAAPLASLAQLVLPPQAAKEVEEYFSDLVRLVETESPGIMPLSAELLAYNLHFRRFCTALGSSLHPQRAIDAASLERLLGLLLRRRMGDTVTALLAALAQQHGGQPAVPRLPCVKIDALTASWFKEVVAVNSNGGSPDVGVRIGAWGRGRSGSPSGNGGGRLGRWQLGVGVGSFSGKKGRYGCQMADGVLALSQGQGSAPGPALVQGSVPVTAPAQLGAVEVWCS